MCFHVGLAVGKSSLMKSVGQAVAEKGVLVEFHCCSSDNNSIDGIYIPEINVAMIDGTAPHIVDPKNPGAVDTIVHLGDYWDEEQIRKHKTDILATTKSISHYFQRAYRYLAVAQIFRTEEESYYRDESALNEVGLNALAKTVIQDALGEAESPTPANTRHLFASAISPGGLVNHLDSIFGAVEKKILINGDPGTGKSTILKKLVKEATCRNISLEVFHCALDPEKIEHVLIPDLNVGVITSTNPHFRRSTGDDLVHDTAGCVLAERLAGYHNDMALARDHYNGAIEQAVSFIKEAKKLHDQLEDYYVPNMDFAAVNRRKEKLLKEILGMLSK